MVRLVVSVGVNSKLECYRCVPLCPHTFLNANVFRQLPLCVSPVASLRLDLQPVHRLSPRSTGPLPAIGPQGSLGLKTV